MDDKRTSFVNECERLMTFEISHFSRRLNSRKSDLFKRYLKLMTVAKRSRRPQAYCSPFFGILSFAWMFVFGISNRSLWEKSLSLCV